MPYRLTGVPALCCCAATLCCCLPIRRIACRRTFSFILDSLSLHTCCSRRKCSTWWSNPSFWPRALAKLLFTALEISRMSACTRFLFFDALHFLQSEFSVYHDTADRVVLTVYRCCETRIASTATMNAVFLARWLCCVSGFCRISKKKECISKCPVPKRTISIFLSFIKIGGFPASVYTECKHVQRLTEQATHKHMRGYNYTGACTGHTSTNRKMQTHKDVWFKNTSHGAERNGQVHFIPFALLLPIAVVFLSFFSHTHNTGRRKGWKITSRQKCCQISSTLLSGATNTSAVWNLKKQFSVSAPPFPSIVMKKKKNVKMKGHLNTI